MRQLLTESLLLAFAGATLGAFLGQLGVQRLFRSMPETMRPWMLADVGVDWRFLAFTVAVVALTAVLFGLLPALGATRVQPQRALQEAPVRASAGAGRRRVLGALVVGEVALAVVLLVGAGLLVQSFRTMMQRDLGFRRDTLTATLALPQATYPDVSERQQFYASVAERIAALPDVEASGLTSLRPLGGHSGTFFDIENGIERPDDDGTPVVLNIRATAGYFDAMGIEFIHGGPHDDLDSEREVSTVAVVNETFARTFWGEPDVVGRRIHIGSEELPWITIVGVTRDTLHYGPDQPMRPSVFMPFRAPESEPVTVAVRGAGAAAAYASAVQALVRDLDADVPVFAVGTMAQHLGDETWTWRTFSGLLIVFATTALLLALGGIYSTLSYVVGQRRMEIGIRMALGARQGQVLAGVLGDGLRLTLLGLAVGLVLAFLAAGLSATALVDAQPRDPRLYLGAGAVLLAAALLANLLPARRAAAIDPLKALRSN